MIDGRSPRSCVWTLVVASCAAVTAALCPCVLGGKGAQGPAVPQGKPPPSAPRRGGTSFGGECRPLPFCRRQEGDGRSHDWGNGSRPPRPVPAAPSRPSARPNEGFTRRDGPWMSDTLLSGTVLLRSRRGVCGEPGVRWSRFMSGASDLPLHDNSCTVLTSQPADAEAYI